MFGREMGQEPGGLNLKMLAKFEFHDIEGT